jgi:hypothetical protein
MTFVNSTGKHPLCPECPNHKGVALIPEPRPTTGGKMSAGFWRCPIDNKVYIDEQPLTVKPL